MTTETIATFEYQLTWVDECGGTQQETMNSTRVTALDAARVKTQIERRAVSVWRRELVAVVSLEPTVTFHD